MRFRSNAVPAPSCGTPSMNTFTCLPLKPSSISCMSEPTPPDSRSFIPGSFWSASLRFWVEFCSSFVSTATALKAERLTRPTPLETTTTSSSSVTEGFSTMFCRLRPSARISTSFSAVSKPMAETINVYFPAGAFRWYRPFSLVVQPYCVPFKYTVAKSMMLLSEESTFPDSKARPWAETPTPMHQHNTKNTPHLKFSLPRENAEFLIFCNSCLLFRTNFLPAKLAWLCGEGNRQKWVI